MGNLLQLIAYEPAAYRSATSSVILSIQHLAPPFLPTTMRRISSFTTSPARLAPGSVRHYGAQPMSVKTMGLLPRGQGFLFQKEEGATSCVQQLNRIYILDKELRDLLRTEARTKPQEVAQSTQASSAEAAPLSPSTLVSTSPASKKAPRSRSARSAQPNKPIRERKAVGSPSS